MRPTGTFKLNGVGSRTMQSALDVAQHFFSRYQERNLEEMLACFSPEGRIDYLPIALEGPAEEVGRFVWSALMDTFPDLSNEVTAAYPGVDGHTVVVEVTISGTQARDAFGIPNQGRRFVLPHVFIIQTDNRQQILRMKAYWDNAAWFSALGRTRLVDPD